MGVRCTDLLKASTIHTQHHHNHRTSAQLAADVKCDYEMPAHGLHTLENNHTNENGNPLLGVE